MSILTFFKEKYSGLFKNYYRVTYQQFFALRDTFASYIRINEEKGRQRIQRKGLIVLDSIMIMELIYLT